MNKVRLSTGLRNALATGYGLAAMMDGGAIYVYGGDPVASPDRAPGQSPLGIVTTEGRTFYHNAPDGDAGLRLRFVRPGGLTNGGEWRLKGLRAGLATWFRWCWAGYEDFSDSDYVPRVDGALGDVFQLPNPAIRPDTDERVDQFLIVIPG